MRMLRCLVFVFFATNGAQAQDLVFDGRVEAIEQAVVSSRINGVISEVLFSGGDRVSAGQPLFRLDATDAELALAVADAKLAQAKARLEGAQRQSARQEELLARGVSSASVVGPVRTELASATAALALADAEREVAFVNLERTVIMAPIEGVVSRPTVQIGTFVEAKAGRPLATVIDLDPIAVAYEIPYADRLASLDATDAASVNEMLSKVRVSLMLPGDRTYPFQSIPRSANPTVNPETGTVTVWADFPNDARLLRPGMMVEVMSVIEESSE